jgi:hypothetical protein
MICTYSIKIASLRRKVCYKPSMDFQQREIKFATNLQRIILLQTFHEFATKGDKNCYSLRPILLFANMDVPTTKMCLDTSVLAKSITGRRKYKTSKIYFAPNLPLNLQQRETKS